MADDQKILKLIEQAAREGRTELDLSGNELTSLPPEISKLTNSIAVSLLTVDYILYYRDGRPTRTPAFILKGRRG